MKEQVLVSGNLGKVPKYIIYIATVAQHDIKQKVEDSIRY